MIVLTVKLDCADGLDKLQFLFIAHLPRYLMSLFVVIIIHRKQVTDRFLAAVAPALIFGLILTAEIFCFTANLELEGCC